MNTAADVDNHWPDWFAAAARPEVDALIRGLYARLDAEVEKRGPVCWASGRCCNFDAFGHRLYVTCLETAWVLKNLPADAPPPPRATDPVEPTCSFQRDGLCGAHLVRPMGCRIFFCHRATDDGQHALYEAFLAELRAAHDRLGIPYVYMEWRASLREAATSL
ncbi:MAG: hypothetical protein NTW19_15995 [Planctomycetota bacterium]|nr:hypothetical protein [Planctomycetota bacterium]